MKDIFDPVQRKRLMELAGIEELQMTDNDGEVVYGKELWDLLPDMLYHATDTDTWEKIKKAGYLGYNYPKATGQTTSNWVDRDYFYDGRRWQKPGWGVYFATTPSVASGHKAPDSNSNEEVILRVKKIDLKPELCYLDGSDTPDSPEDNDLEYLRSSTWAIFYAGKVPVDNLSIYSGQRLKSRKTLENLNILRKTARKASEFFKEIPNRQLLGGHVTESRGEYKYYMYGIYYRVLGIPGVEILSYENELEPGMGQWVHNIVFYGTEPEDWSSRESRKAQVKKFQERFGMPDLEFPYGYFYQRIKDCPKINVPVEKLQ